jgi:predicted RNA methylase
MVENNGLDQFYTRNQLAKCCYDAIKNKVPNYRSFDMELEPSAGTGAFYKLMSHTKRYGIDIDPKYDGVIKQDFFEYYPEPFYKKIITIGNPPFGRNASIAIKFFNHAAKFSKVIAFIVPKSFKKTSVQNKLDLNFWMIYEKDCPAKSFVINDMEYDVPCVFQIWIKKSVMRIKKVIDLNNDVFEFVKNSNDSDIAIRRVGGTTGTCKESNGATETTHYFIKLKPCGMLKKDLMKFINSLDFDSVRNSTAGPRSLSKQEFVEIFFNNMRDANE